MNSVTEQDVLERHVESGIVTNKSCDAPGRVVDVLFWLHDRMDRQEQNVPSTHFLEVRFQTASRKEMA